jgi:hypothetical protein
MTKAVWRMFRIELIVRVLAGLNRNLKRDNSAAMYNKHSNK